MILERCSDEQKAVVQAARDGCCAVASALPGSGKTTCLLAMHLALPDVPKLLLTYSKKLAGESNGKFQAALMSQKVCYTLHAFVSAFYDPSGFDDKHMRSVLDRDLPPTRPFSYQIIAGDEWQDLCPLYQELFLKIIRDNGKKDAQIFILGDRFQSIYGYKGSDARYLTLAQRIYGHCTTREWRHLALTETFRLPMPHADFMNVGAFRTPMFRSRKEGKKPIVVRASPFTAVKEILDRRIITIHGGRSGQLPASGSFAMDGVFMMAQSLHQNGSADIPIRATSNHLSQRGYNILYKSSDETAGHEKDESDGKIVFSTFHGSKGSERGLVVCFGADGSWYRFFDKDNKEPRDFPPNIWTVAMTRCTEQLVLIQSPNEEPLPFIAWDQCGDYFDYIDLTGDSVPRPMKALPPLKDQPLAVTKLLSHQPWEELDAAMAHVTVTELPSDEAMPDHPLKIKGRFDTVEDISDILGRAVGLYLEYSRTRSLKWISGKEKGKGKAGEDAYLSKSVVKPMMRLVGLVQQGAAKLSDIENLAVYVHAVDELLVHRVKQLPETLSILSKHESALEGILSRLPPMREYERGVEMTACGRTVVGICDSVMEVLAPTELKYTSVISPEHFLQAACYHHMMSPCPPTLLANIRTGQRFHVEAKPSFGQALACLVANKTRKKTNDISDEEFLRVADLAAQKWKPGSEKHLVKHTKPRKKRGTNVEDDRKQRTLLCWFGREASPNPAILCP
jgi:UvrD-like helicase family protein